MSEKLEKKVEALANCMAFSIAAIGWKKTWCMIDEVSDADRRLLLRKIYHKFLNSENRKNDKIKE